MLVKLLKENRVGWTIGGVVHDIESEFEIEDNVYESAISAGVKLERVSKSEAKRKKIQDEVHNTDG